MVVKGSHKDIMFLGTPLPPSFRVVFPKQELNYDLVDENTEVLE